jgi:ATP-dependent protease ClpP protease subunit
MGAVLLETVCDERIAVPQAMIMFHQASLNEVSGNEQELHDWITFLNVLEHGVEVRVCKRIHMPIKEYQWRTRRAWWLTAKLALKYHVIDRIIPDGSKLPPLVPIHLPPAVQLQ